MTRLYKNNQNSFNGFAQHNADNSSKAKLSEIITQNTIAYIEDKITKCKNNNKTAYVDIIDYKLHDAFYIQDYFSKKNYKASVKLTQTKRSGNELLMINIQ